MAMVIDPIAKKPFFNFFSIKGSYLLKPTLLAPDRALCCVCKQPFRSSSQTKYSTLLKWQPLFLVQIYADICLQQSLYQMCLSFLSLSPLARVHLKLDFFKVGRWAVFYMSNTLEPDSVSVTEALRLCHLVTQLLLWLKLACSCCYYLYIVFLICFYTILLKQLESTMQMDLTEYNPKLFIRTSACQSGQVPMLYSTRVTT